MAYEQKRELLALYELPEKAAGAVSRLQEAGFSRGDYEILTATPYPEGAFGEGHTKHRLFAFPFAGAACGLAFGIVWVVGAQLTVPIITGGKPIVGVPAFLQILYEGTLLGAVIMTVIGVLFESRLPDGISLYDDRIADGLIGVAVVATEQRILAARQALEQAGAVDILKKEGRLVGLPGRSTSS